MAEPIVSASWSTAPQSSPLADLRAVAALFADIGLPVTSPLVALVSAETMDRLTGKPLSADLTGDPLACAILRQWARQPWQEAHRAALVDRMLELGYGEREVCWSRMFVPGWLAGIRTIFRNLPRRAVRRWLAPWRAKLIEQFGDFESNTLP
jgi:hypothetical protein